MSAKSRKKTTKKTEKIILPKDTGATLIPTLFTLDEKARVPVVFPSDSPTMMDTGKVSWKNGWSFETLLSGAVRIVVVDPADHTKILAETTVPETDWSKILWKLSMVSDMAVGQSLFKALHCG